MRRRLLLSTFIVACGGRVDEAVTLAPPEPPVASASDARVLDTDAISVDAPDETWGRVDASALQTCGAFRVLVPARPIGTTPANLTAIDVAPLDGSSFAVVTTSGAYDVENSFDVVRVSMADLSATLVHHVTTLGWAPEAQIVSDGSDVLMLARGDGSADPPTGVPLRVFRFDGAGVLGDAVTLTTDGTNPVTFAAGAGRWLDAWYPTKGPGGGFEVRDESGTSLLPFTLWGPIDPRKFDAARYGRGFAWVAPRYTSLPDPSAQQLEIFFVRDDGTLVDAKDTIPPRYDGTEFAERCIARWPWSDDAVVVSLYGDASDLVHLYAVRDDGSLVVSRDEPPRGLSVLANDREVVTSSMRRGDDNFPAQVELTARGPDLAPIGETCVLPVGPFGGWGGWAVEGVGDSWVVVWSSSAPGTDGGIAPADLHAIVLALP